MQLPARQSGVQRVACALLLLALAYVFREQVVAAPGYVLGGRSARSGRPDAVARAAAPIAGTDLYGLDTPGSWSRDDSPRARGFPARPPPNYPSQRYSAPQGDVPSQNDAASQRYNVPQGEVPSQTYAQPQGYVPRPQYSARQRATDPQDYVPPGSYDESQRYAPVQKDYVPPGRYSVPQGDVPSQTYAQPEGAQQGSGRPMGTRQGAGLYGLHEPGFWSRDSSPRAPPPAASQNVPPGPGDGAAQQPGLNVPPGRYNVPQGDVPSSTYAAAKGYAPPPNYRPRNPSSKFVNDPEERYT